MSYYWVTLESGHSGCVDAENKEEAMRWAMLEKGSVKSVEVLPYPAEPRWRANSSCPPFCWTPRQCAGRTCCPKDYACSN